MQKTLTAALNAIPPGGAVRRGPLLSALLADARVLDATILMSLDGGPQAESAQLADGSALEVGAFTFPPAATETEAAAPAVQADVEIPIILAGATTAAEAQDALRLAVESYLATPPAGGLTADGMIAVIQDLIDQFPGIVSIEDPLFEDDLEGWRKLTAAFASLMVVGDDLFATNIDRLQQAIPQGVANASLCKVNQIGTLTEAMDAARYAQRNGYPVVMSVRSGETEDDVLSDISVALDAGLFKTGGIRGSDRGTNYNRFLEIEADLGRLAQYAGNDYKRVL